MGSGWAGRDGATPELDEAGSSLEKPSAFRMLGGSGAVPHARPSFPAEAPRTKQPWVGWAEAAGPGGLGCRRNGCKSPCLLLLLPNTHFLHLCLEAWHDSVHADRAQGVQLLLIPPPWAVPRVFFALFVIFCVIFLSYFPFPGNHRCQNHSPAWPEPRRP